MVVQYAAVRQILYVFCAYRHGQWLATTSLIFYKLATLRAMAYTRPKSFHKVYITRCSVCPPANSVKTLQSIQRTNIMLLTSWRSRCISATWGSRLTTGLFLIFLARSAYLRVPSVSSVFESAGLMQAIIRVWLLPPSESAHKCAHANNFLTAKITNMSVLPICTLAAHMLPLSESHWVCATSYGATLRLAKMGQTDGWMDTRPLHYAFCSMRTGNKLWDHTHTGNEIVLVFCQQKNLLLPDMKFEVL